MKFLRILAIGFGLSVVAPGKTHIAVFVGLADNATQGIAKVPAKIGDGNRPDDNLYWGCSEGLKAYFKASPTWKLQPGPAATGDGRILETLVFRHKTRDAVLVAEAWRGANLRECYEAFQNASLSGRNQLVVFIGHNVLMDANIPPPATTAGKSTDVMVLCCKSDSYFRQRIETSGLRPVLMTTQSMYPGSFLLHDALEPWFAGKDRAAIRNAAGVAYARNQKISVAAATGVFAKLELPILHPVRPKQAPLPPRQMPFMHWWFAASAAALIAGVFAYLLVRRRFTRKRLCPSSPSDLA